MTRLVNESEAIRTVMALLKIEGVTGAEGAVARFIRRELVKAGVPPKSIRADRANAKFPFKAETGNLVAEIPGRGSLARARPRLFCAHMDTVVLAAGTRPVRRGRRIAAAGETALGADDRSGCGVLVTLARTLARLRPDHPPLVLLFTAAEETGLWGARYAETKPLAQCAMGFSYDGGDPADVVVAAPSSDTFSLEITGHASHAGVHPELGVNAGVVFAEATARLSRDGWLGKIRKGSGKSRSEGTSNIGVVEGGLATNIVMPSLRAKGEARSYSAAFLDRIIGTVRKEFERAASRAMSAKGERARVRFTRTAIYRAFDLGDDVPVVVAASRAAEDVGLRPKCKRQFGGLDANWLNAHGVPTVTLGAGARHPHGAGETLEVGEYLLGCEMAVRLATAPAPVAESRAARRKKAKARRK